MIVSDAGKPFAIDELDNYATHKHPKVLAWLARHPRWTFHFTPTYQENARLRSGLLLEAQQRTKWRLINRRLAYRSLATADRDGVNAESRPAMTEARARDKLAEGRSGAQESMARHP